jgi:ADP-ribosylglycohydrolase
VIADRIAGCLKGIAVGDAIGKQTETLSAADIATWYPNGIRGFEGTPGAIIPRYVGNSKHEWRIGETTDDTERTIAVGRAIIGEHKVSHTGIGRELLRCRKCVHPGVRSLWEFHQAADPARIATMHDGCGAAVRVAPVGIFHCLGDLDALVHDAREAAISTHGGSLAIAAAAATAAAVSAAIGGAPALHVLSLAARAAAAAESRWPGASRPAESGWPGASPPSFANAIRIVHDELASLPAIQATAVAACCFPDRPLTIVPLALGLATTMNSAEEAILLASNVGGDSDSVASIAGGILGALYPHTVNQEWYEVVERVNGHNLTALAAALMALRH